MSRLQVQATAGSHFGSGAAIGETSTTVSGVTDIDGNALSMADFGSVGYATSEPGSGLSEESISFTGFVDNGNGTQTLSGISSVLSKSPYTATSGFLKGHSSGVRFVITDTAKFHSEFLNKNQSATVAEKYTFTEAQRPVLSADLDSADPTALATVGQVGRTAAAGAGNASTTVKGIVEIPVTAEMTSGASTGGTGALLTPTPAQIAAQIQSGSWLYAVEDGVGADDAYTVTFTPAPTVLTAGMVIVVKFTVANTLAATLNPNALGAKAIKKYVSGAKADIETGDIVANYVGLLEYDGTDFVLLSMTAALPTTALLSEMAAFFGIYNGTGTEANTLRNGATTDASSLHTHPNQSLDRLDQYNTFRPDEDTAVTINSNTTGANSLNKASITLNNGGSAGAILAWTDLTIASWDVSQTFDVFCKLDATTGMLGFIGLGLGTSGTPASTAVVERHAGFFMDSTGAIKASVADGTTQNISASLSISYTVMRHYRIEFTASSVTFYVDNALVATLSTNIPTGSTAYTNIRLCNNAANRVMTTTYPVHTHRC